MELEPLEAKLQDTNLPPATLEALLDLPAEGRAGRLKQINDQAKDFPSRQKAIDAFVSGHDAAAGLGGGLDSADELKRLLRGSGVLSFHIMADDTDAAAYEQAVQPQAEGPQAGDDKRWFEMARGESGGEPTAASATAWSTSTPTTRWSTPPACRSGRCRASTAAATTTAATPSTCRSTPSAAGCSAS